MLKPFDRVIRDRLEVLAPLVKSGSVLDVGCVDARPERHDSAWVVQSKPNLLFKRLCEINPRTVGLDIDAQGVAALKDAGFDAIVGDAQTIDLQRQFDTIVAGEVIEHVTDPGRFLLNMRRHLTPKGHLAISTPNPFYCGQTWKIWHHGSPEVNEGHVCWFDPITLCQLLKRTGFELAAGYWVQPRRSIFKNWKRVFRKYFSHSFLCVARRDDSQGGQ
jgi:SAM-dependent methyltransferase